MEGHKRDITTAEDANRELDVKDLESVSGGYRGNNVVIPDGHMMVCAECGSPSFYYSVSAGGFPICFDCGSVDFNIVPE